MALSKLGYAIGAVALGEAVGMISETLSRKVKAHRMELTPAMGLSTPDSVTDLTVDSLTQMVFLLIGIDLVASAMPSVTANLSTLTFFLFGVTSQSSFPLTIRRLTKAISEDPNPLTATNLAPTTTTEVSKVVPK